MSHLSYKISRVGSRGWLTRLGHCGGRIRLPKICRDLPSLGPGSQRALWTSDRPAVFPVLAPWETVPQICASVRLHHGVHSSFIFIFRGSMADDCSRNLSAEVC